MNIDTIFFVIWVANVPIWSICLYICIKHLFKSTRYFCQECNCVLWRLIKGKCPFCRGVCELVDVERSKFVGWGVPTVIGLGTFFFAFWCFAVRSTMGRLLGFIFMYLMMAVTVILLYILNFNKINQKVCQIKGVPAIGQSFKKVSGHTCTTCGKDLPLNCTSCPYCGRQWI